MLMQVVRHWNIHRIRPSTGARCPAGVPDELFYFPVAPAVDCLMRDIPPLSDDILVSLSPPTTTADADFGEYLMYVCQQHQWEPPSSVTEAAALYRRLQPFV